MSERRRLEKAHALNTAKNVKASRVGCVMLKDNTHEDRLLQSRLTGLDKQRKRHQMHLDQAKKQFINLRVLPEPTIIVERPSTPGTYLTLPGGGDDVTGLQRSGVKHYMTPLQHQQRLPSTLPTFDAFVCRRRKKVNTWDDAVAELNKPTFINTVHPCNPLTPRELKDLEVGWLYHTPTRSAQLRDKRTALSEEANNNAKNNNKQQRSKSNTIPISVTSQGSVEGRVRSSGVAFITQIEEEAVLRETTQANGVDKRVTFKLGTPRGRMHTVV